VTSCSQLEDLDALVMDELDAGHARELRAHAATCPACATELSMLTAERALFAHRAEALDVFVAPPAMTVAAPAILQMRRLLPTLGRIVVRGQFSAACAAALFVVAALSRLGTSSMSMSMSLDDGMVSMSADEGAAGSGMLASYREGEPLACSTGMFGQLVGSGSFVGRGASGAMSRDDGAMTSSSSGASRGEVLACGGGGALEGARGGASCEPSVTCSAVRQ
jgi:hypothetical protein